MLNGAFFHYIVTMQILLLDLIANILVIFRKLFRAIVRTQLLKLYIYILYKLHDNS